MCKTVSSSKDSCDLHHFRGRLVDGGGRNPLQLPGSPGSAENVSGSGEAASQKQGVSENMAEPWGIGVAVSRGNGSIGAAAAASNVGWDSWMAVRILAWLSLRDFH